MTSAGVQELFPIEVTTHNLHFHEEASIFSIDTFSDLMATGGGDGVVRLWKFKDTGSRKDEDFRYTTALNSSIKLAYFCEVNGHEKTVNCVRFSKDGILASSSDGGKVILYFNDQNYLLRKYDGQDCYDLTWASSRLFVGLSSGMVEVYEIFFNENFETTLQYSFSPHSDVIQGLAYNDIHDIFLTISKDKTAKLYKEKILLEKYSQFQNAPMFSGGRSFFRRTCFNKTGDLAYICNVKKNSVLVLKYPFKTEHWLYKIGPFNSEIVKILDTGDYLFIFSKLSVYICKDNEILACVDNICFKSITDATVINNLIFISSLDGFVSSIRWK